MKTSKRPMFDDRRLHQERRDSVAEMPERFSRRSSDRRLGGFNQQPWWLNVDYYEELAVIHIDDGTLPISHKPPSQKASQ